MTKENRKDMISKKRRGRKPIPLDKVHPNTPRRLIALYKRLGFSQLNIVKEIKVNDYYISKLMKYGIEPTDKTENGQSVRIKLFLPRLKRKQKIISDKPKRIIPEFIKLWNHLPTDERQKVIQEYLKWKGK